MAQLGRDVRLQKCLLSDPCDITITLHIKFLLQRTPVTLLLDTLTVWCGGTPEPTLHLPNQGRMTGFNGFSC